MAQHRSGCYHLRFTISAGSLISPKQTCAPMSLARMKAARFGSSRSMRLVWPRCSERGELTICLTFGRRCAWLRKRGRFTIGAGASGRASHSAGTTIGPLCAGNRREDRFCQRRLILWQFTLEFHGQVQARRWQEGAGEIRAQRDPVSGDRDLGNRDHVFAVLFFAEGHRFMRTAIR